MAYKESMPSQHGGIGRRYIRFTNTLSTVCGVLAATLVLCAVLVTCQMIFVRFVLNHSTIWQTEMVVYLMVSATLIGLPYVQRLRGHVNVDLLPLMLGPGLRKALALLVLVASIAVVVIMLFYGFEQWLVAWQKGWTSDTVWGVRLWIPYLALPVGFAFFLLQIVADITGILIGYERPFGLEERR